MFADHRNWIRLAVTALALGVFCWPTALAQQPAAPAKDTRRPLTTDPQAPAGTPRAMPLTAADLAAFIDGAMAAHMPAQEIPTAVVAVVKDGQILFSKGYGFADREKRTPVDPARTLFRPGSVSKLFTWTAVVQLHERGLLDLDADINTYLKDFQIPATFPQPITMKHLLTHTPGFEDGALGFLFVRDPSKIVPLSQSLAAHIPRRVRPPGTFSSYSNWGTAVAGLIVANISGMSFEEYVEKNILQPLGMEHSTFREPLPENLAPYIATGYRYRAGVFKPEGFEYIANFAPAGGLSASAEDMARFMIAHLQLGQFGGKRILEEGTARKMHSQIYTLDPRLPGMAYGFYESEMNGQRIIGHGGDTLWFHTNLALLPAHNLGLYVSYVTGGGRARLELLKGFLDRYFPEPGGPVLKNPADFKERGRRFAGAFRFTRHNWSTIEKLLALASTLTVSINADGNLVLSGLGENPMQFVEVEPLLFRQIDGWQTLAFKEDPSGGISHMFIGMLPFMPTYRVPWYEAPPVGYLPVIVGLLLCLTILISAFYHWRLARHSPAAGAVSPGARWAMRLAVLTALLTLVFAVSLVAVIQAGQDDLIYELPRSLTAVLILPHLTALLSVALVAFALLSWFRSYDDWGWRFFRRVHYSLFALAMLALTWFYLHWNLLGFKY
jgi:CubicO group peptidase (beta-lactamase class C family)